MGLFSCIIPSISSSTSSPLSPTVPCLNAAVVVSLLLILFSFALVVIAYLLSEVLQIQGLKNWYLSELWETIKTCLMVASIFFVLVILSAIATTYISPGSFTPSYPSAPLSLSTVTSDLNYNLGYLYISDQSFLSTQIGVTNNAFYSMLGLSEGLGIMKSINVSLWAPTLVITGFLQAGFVGVPIYTSDYFVSSSSSSTLIGGGGIGSGMITNLESYAIIPTLFLLYIEQYLFYSIIAIALLVFLPLGIIFRSIPLFRNVGALMIAIAIGIAIIFPTLLLALNEPVINFVANTFGISLYSTASTPPPIADINICSNVLGYTSSGLLKNFCNHVASYITTITSWFSKLNPDIPSQYISEVKYGINTAYASLYTSYPIVNYTLEYGIIPIVELILFTVDLMITFISINSISALLGGRALQTSFGKRVKLI